MAPQLLRICVVDKNYDPLSKMKQQSEGVSLLARHHMPGKKEARVQTQVLEPAS